MATRSDFAQKLLNDLRIRKEQMAAASQGSGYSTSMAGADVYGNPKQANRGSRQIKALELVGSKPTKPQRRSIGSAKSLSIEESSKQIVTFRRGHNENSAKIGNLSMVLAFALENGIKLNTMGSTGNYPALCFLQQFSRSLDAGKMERRNSFHVHRPSIGQLPTLSQAHINEISKGAQKLNQILRAYSNGLNLDRYSVEIAKQLLKGAMDLEESLRMLVNVQEASEYMNTSHKKTRIRLLDEDEDDDEYSAVEEAKQKQLVLPKFSFDKPSRNSHGIKDVARTDMKHRLITLAYTDENPNLRGKQALNASNLVAHMRSDSSGADFKAPSAPSASSKSKPDKGRISNVVAKLMGLEEIPENVGTKNTLKESSSKQKEGMILKKNINGSSRNADSGNRYNQNIAPLGVGKNVTQTAKVTQNNQVNPNVNSKSILPERKLPWKDLDEIDKGNPLPAPRKAIPEVYKQENNVTHPYQVSRSQNDFKDKARLDDKKRMENKDAKWGETQQPVKYDFQKDKTPEEEISKEKNGSNRSTLQNEAKISNRLPQRNGQKPQRNLHQQQMLQKPMPQDKRHQAENCELQHVREKLHGRVHKESEIESENSSKSMADIVSPEKKHLSANHTLLGKTTETEDEGPLKGESNGRQHEDVVNNRSSTNSTVRTRNSMKHNINQNTSRRQLGPETEKKNVTSPPIKGKPLNVPTTREKIAGMKLPRGEALQGIDEAIGRRNNGSLPNFARPLRHQVSISHDVKERKLDKFGSSKRAEKVSAIRLKEVSNGSDEVKELHKEGEQVPASCSSMEYEHPSLDIPHSPTKDDTGQDLTTEPSQVFTGHAGQATILSNDQQLRPQKNLPSPLDGTNDRSTKISQLSNHEYKEISTSKRLEPLTENETHLKLMLIKSQLFLHTAEALFKLNMPVGILHVSDYSSQAKDDKLIIDCGYETMRRKGRRQELSVYPFIKVSVSSVRVSSLDQLVKQLSEDFGKLRSYGRIGNNEYDTAENLSKMLEKDIQENKDPDINCMWDLGWNETMFAVLEKEETMRDVENQVLNGLLDEITRDLLPVCAF